MTGAYAWMDTSVVSRDMCILERYNLGNCCCLVWVLNGAHQGRDRSRQAANIGAIPMLSWLEHRHNNNVHSYTDIAMHVVGSSVVYRYGRILYPLTSVTLIHHLRHSHPVLLPSLIPIDLGILTTLQPLILLPSFVPLSC